MRNKLKKFSMCAFSTFILSSVLSTGVMAVDNVDNVGKVDSNPLLLPNTTPLSLELNILFDQWETHDFPIVKPKKEYGHFKVISNNYSGENRIIELIRDCKPHQKKPARYEDVQIDDQSNALSPCCDKIIRCICKILSETSWESAKASIVLKKECLTTETNEKTVRTLKKLAKDKLSVDKNIYAVGFFYFTELKSKENRENWVLKDDNHIHTSFNKAYYPGLTEFQSQLNKAKLEGCKVFNYFNENQNRTAIIIIPDMMSSSNLMLNFCEKLAKNSKDILNFSNKFLSENTNKNQNLLYDNSVAFCRVINPTGKQTNVGIAFLEELQSIYSADKNVEVYFSKNDLNIKTYDIARDQLTLKEKAFKEYVNVKKINCYYDISNSKSTSISDIISNIKSNSISDSISDSIKEFKITYNFKTSFCINNKDKLATIFFDKSVNAPILKNKLKERWEKCNQKENSAFYIIKMNNNNDDFTIEELKKPLSNDGKSVCVFFSKNAAAPEADNKEADESTPAEKDIAKNDWISEGINLEKICNVSVIKLFYDINGKKTTTQYNLKDKCVMELSTNEKIRSYTIHFDNNVDGPLLHKRLSEDLKEALKQWAINDKTDFILKIKGEGVYLAKIDTERFLLDDNYYFEHKFNKLENTGIIINFAEYDTSYNTYFSKSSIEDIKRIIIGEIYEYFPNNPPKTILCEARGGGITYKGQIEHPKTEKNNKDKCLEESKE